MVVAKAYRKKSKISSFLLNQRVLNVSDVTSVNNTFKIDNVDYPVYASTPFSDLKNKRYAITRENAIENNRLTMVLQTLDDRVTPKIDRNTLSMNTRYYIINDRADEVGTSKYVSKKISIKNPADQINLTLSINRPAPGCDVKVYIKLFDQTGEIIDPAVTGSIESPNILTPYWFYLPPTAPTSIPVNSLSSAGYIFNDVVYSRNWADDGIEFSSYILKFVFISDNWVDVPRIKDYRSIVTS